MRGVEAGEAETAIETAAAQGLGEGATDPGAVEGETGMTPGTEEGETETIRGTGEGEIAATPGITGGAATAQTDPMTKIIIGQFVNHDLRCKSCNHARQYCKVYPTNHFVAFDIYFECTG